MLTINEESRFYINGDIHMHSRNNKELIIFSNIPEWFTAEAQTYDAIASFDGIYGKDILKLSQEKLSLAEYLIESKLLLSESEIKTDEEIETEIFPLNGMWINVDSNCNLRCKHCFIGETLDETDEKLTVEEIRQLAIEFRQLSNGNLRVVIAGGEPLLRKDIIDIIDAVNIDGLSVNLITNGLLLEDEVIEYLASNKIDVTISIDGPNKESHEYIRGKNTFDRTIRNVQKCSQKGVPIILSMSIHKGNQKYVMDYFEFAENLGAKKVILGFLNNIGNAAINGMEDSDETEIILNLLEQAANDERIHSKIMNTAICKLVETLLFPIKTDCCGSGINNCSILANGDIMPCPSFQGAEFKAGNIKERSFREIWNDPKIFSEHRRVNISNLNDVCSKCEVRFFCGGGCRALSYYTKGNLYARNPQCLEQKKLYIELMWLLDKYPTLRELRTAESRAIFG